MGQYSDALGAPTSFLFHGLWPMCWQAVLWGFLKGTQSTSVTFHQGEAGKADIHCSIGGLRGKKKKKKKPLNPFQENPAQAGQVRFWSGCLRAVPTMIVIRTRCFGRWSSSREWTMVRFTQRGNSFLTSSISMKVYIPNLFLILFTATLAIVIIYINVQVCLGSD